MKIAKAKELIQAFTDKTYFRLDHSFFPWK